MDKIKSGDVVTLKSGGPKMTVQIVDHTGLAFCVFYNEVKSTIETLEVYQNVLKLHVG